MGSLFPPGTLARRAQAVSAHALATGALEPITTQAIHVEQAGVRFLVRQLDGAAAAQDKPRRSEPAGRAEVNPFLPYETDLFVAELSATHVCLLNKFPVIPNHLLIVTRAYEEQDAPLTLEDFTALWTCLAEVDGLAFYNSGRVSGASQRHKHLQLAPLPLEPGGPPLPITPLIARLGLNPTRETRPTRIPEFPFRHAFAWLPPVTGDSPLTAAEATAELHRHLLQRTGIWRGEGVVPAPHNWLATREWLLVVPRSREQVGGIGVNALGFAGSFVVRSTEQLAWLRAQGPLNFLRQVVEE